MSVDTTKICLYISGILLVLASKVTTMITYNTSMSIATILLVITLLIDTQQSYAKKNYLKAVLLLFSCVILLFLLIYLWKKVL